MRLSKNLIRPKGWLSAGLLLCLAVTASQAQASEFGRVSGTVTDASGTPLMGATVLLAGTGEEAGEIGKSVERAFTDAHGDFSIDHVVPGWYSLQVISATRLPALRTGVRVKSDETTKESFTLGDVFSSIRWKDPKVRAHTWTDEWKWILRTSASTRPVLRFGKAKAGRQTVAKRSPLRAKRLVAVIPGPARGDALASDPGMGTVVAYLRPLDENSDVLVAGSTSNGNIGSSSFAAVYRKGLAKKNRQEVTLAVHRLSLDNGLAASVPSGHGLGESEGMIFRYAQTRQLSNALTLTTGVEVRYLSSVQDTGTTNPQVSLAYRVNPRTLVTLGYGETNVDGSPTLLDRVNDLSAFPRISLRNHRPLLENANHAELRLDRDLGPASTFEVAAYHDAFRNVAVWAVGGVQGLDGMAAEGNMLLKAGGSTAVLNGGRYGSSGVHAAYQRKLGHHTQMGMMYAFGNTLAVVPTESSLEAGSLGTGDVSGLLRSEFTQSFSGEFSTRLPAVGTQVVTTYTWLPSGRLTVVDPYGQSRMEFQPFLNVEVRQPLPKIDALPVRIVATADFRNLLAQGSVSVGRSNGRPVFLTPAYRTVRGGFAVQF